MKRLKNIVFFCILGIAVSACSRYPKDVEYALKLAGNNRAELERVLEQYRTRPGDSLKYRAACYLIGNMPGKYSEDDRPTEVYQAFFDAWYRLIDGKVLDKVKSFDSLVSACGLKSQQKIFYDVNYITATYLSNNIERSFEVWQGQPWGKDVPFDIFCEQILPYRLGTEPLEYWRDTVLSRYNDLYHKLQAGDADILAACAHVYDEAKIKWNYPTFHTSLPDMSYTMLDRFRAGYCWNSIKLGGFIMRALGIPVTLDYTPQWPDRGLNHEWNAVWTKDGKYQPFSFTENKPGELHKPGRKMAKAFRYIYHKNSESLAMKTFRTKDKVPEIFRSPFIADISSEKFPVADVTLHFKRLPKKINYLYLSIFDNRDWVPIQWANVKKDVVFRDMGKEIVYLPTYYEQEKVSPCESPLILHENGSLHFLKADTGRRQSVTLYRKYPFLYAGLHWWGFMKGGKFQAANKPDFSDAVLLHHISEEPDLYYQEISPEHSMKYRYYRYYSPDGGKCNIAELEFYKDGEDIPAKGKIIGSSGSAFGDTGNTIDKAFDGDILTYFQARWSSGEWVGMDCGEKVTITKIRYLPRNDDNNIVKGQLYELMYWGDNGWISLGQQEADGYTLHYDNIPTNALFLLRNHSKGKEERIFTYENGKQVWW